MTDPQLILGYVGVNVTRSGADDLLAIAAAGLQGIRIPATIADAGPPTMRYDLRDYLRLAQSLGLKVILLLDRDAFYWPDWRVETARYVTHWLDTYGGLIDAIETGNESDHKSDYSWDLPAEDWSALLRAVHDVVRAYRSDALDGRTLYLLAGGLVSGDPNYLTHVDLSSVNAYCVHPYLKDAPSDQDLEDVPDVDELHHAYELMSTLPVVESEWGWPSDWGADRQAEEAGEMVAWAFKHGCPLYLYNWRDGGESFGLLDASGVPKPALAAVSAAIAALPTGIPAPPIPEPPPPSPEPAPPEPGPEPVPTPPISDPWRFWTPQQLALACDAPLANILEHWPPVVGQLALCGINEYAAQLAAVANLAIETGGPDRSRRFTPVREAYWLSDEWREANLWYYPHYGRGLLQITLLENYILYNRLLRALWATNEIDLVLRPDEALDRDVSAAIVGLYFLNHGGLGLALVVQAARVGDWTEVRRLIQGGSAGLDRLRQIVGLLGEQQTIPVISFDRTYPRLAQNDPWSCWPTSARWMLGALGADADQDGQPPSEAYVEGQALRDGIVSMELGLLVATAGPAARWLNEQWLSAMGLTATAYQNVSWEQAHDLSDQGGLLLGGDAWNHWTAVTRSGGTPDSRYLALANPDENWKSVGAYLSEVEFRRWGPWNAIGVPIAGQEDPAVIAELQAQLARCQQEAATLKRERDDLVVAFSVAADDHGDEIQVALDKIRELRTIYVGPRPPEG